MWALNNAFQNLILHSLTYQTLSNLIPAAALLVSGTCLRYGWLSSYPRYIKITQIGVLTLSALFISADIFVYLASAFSYDHGDAAVTTIGAAVRNGQLTHSGISGAHGFYSLPYGPLLFETQRLVLTIWPTIEASKLVGIAAFVFGIAVLVRQMGAKQLLTFSVPLFIAALIVIRHDSFAYGIRSKSILFALVALSGTITLRPEMPCAALCLGLLIGLAAGFKITAVIFFVPTAALLFCRTKIFADLAKTGALIASGAALTFFPVFALPSVGTSGYFAQLALSTRVGYSPALLLDNMAEILLMLSPGLLLILRQKARLGQENLGLVAGTFAAAIAASLIGSKIGTGSTSLIPFVAVAVAVNIRMAKEGDVLRSDVISQANLLGAGLAAMTYLPILFVATVTLYTRGRDIGETSAVVTEAQQIYREHPDAQMGVGGAADYNLTAVRAIGTLRGGPLLFDPATWMEFAYVEPAQAEDMSLAFLSGCRIRAWVIPNGSAPFTMPNWNEGQNFFTEAFRQKFSENYIGTNATSHFSVWVCRSDKNA